MHNSSNFTAYITAYIMKACLITVAVLLFNLSPAVANPIDSRELEDFIDQVMAGQMQELGIPNATVAVVDGGKVVLSKGYGYANLDQQRAVDPDRTLFRIGSISKLFTWTAVMQLAEQGKLDLDADVNNYLDFVIPAQLQKPPANEKTPGKYKPAPITLAHLMTHTPGFEDVSEELFVLSPDKMPPLDEYIHTYLPARVFPPGEVAAYSNYGTALAGYIIERVSGLPFPEYIEQNIFTPLGMKHSTFRQPLPDELSPNMARAYRLVNGEYLEGSFEYMPVPAGGMSTTASDVAKFMIAHLQGGSLSGSLNEVRILQEETALRMHSRQFTHHPEQDGMAFGFMEGTFNGVRTLFHGGSTMLFNSGLYLLPEKNAGIFVSYSGGNYLAQVGLFNKFMDRYFPASSLQLDQKPDNSALAGDATERSHRFVGEYHPNRRSFTTMESVISLMGATRINISDDGYLLATHLGETNRFAEIEPGVYRSLREERNQDPFGAFKTLVFDTYPLGGIMLASGGPMTYSKAPWYATTKFTVSALIIALLILGSSLIFWIVGFLWRLLRGQPRPEQSPEQPKIASAARWTAITFSILTLGLLIGYGIISKIDPVYGVPISFFGILPVWSPLLNLLPMLMALLGVAIVIFTGVIWWKRSWRAIERVHYTLYAAGALVLLWILNYWNFLKWTL